MDNTPEDGVRSTAEVVFVLRMRAEATGWCGQVQRLDGHDGARTRYIGGLRELYALLEQDWQLARSTQTGPGPP
jgi:hypothetical protein